MKKILSLAAMLLAGAMAFAQVTTAASFFSSVSQNYASIKDYQADVAITINKQEMAGKVTFKRPELLRIDFTSPAEQCICFDGETLKIYLPGAGAILEQSVDQKSSGSAGLSLLSRSYSVAYATSQNAEPLEEGSEEMVINLVLTPRYGSEAFRKIEMAVNPNTKLIRRVVAYARNGNTFKFDFSNYSLNTGITDQRFIYDPPTSANNYNNFLFGEQQ